MRRWCGRNHRGKITAHVQFEEELDVRAYTLAAADSSSPAAAAAASPDANTHSSKPPPVSKQQQKARNTPNTMDTSHLDARFGSSSTDLTTPAADTTSAALPPVLTTVNQTDCDDVTGDTATPPVLDAVFVDDKKISKRSNTISKAQAVSAVSALLEISDSPPDSVLHSSESTASEQDTSVSPPISVTPSRDSTASEPDTSDSPPSSVPPSSSSSTASEQQGREYLYQLSAVVMHHGRGFGSGHYTAYCWNEQAGE